MEEDLSKGILEAIDMDSYRVEKQAAVKIELPDADAEIEPVPTTGGGHKPEPELDSALQHPQNLQRSVRQASRGPTPTGSAGLSPRRSRTKVAADTAYQNAQKNSDKQNARIEHDKALERVMAAVLKDDTQLFGLFMDNESFRRWLTDTVFSLTYDRPAGEKQPGIPPHRTK